MFYQEVVQTDFSLWGGTSVYDLTLNEKTHFSSWGSNNRLFITSMTSCWTKKKKVLLRGSDNRLFIVRLLNNMHTHIQYTHAPGTHVEVPINKLHGLVKGVVAICTHAVKEKKIEVHFDCVREGLRFKCLNWISGVLSLVSVIHHYHHHHLSLKREGRWGPTDDFASSFLHFCLFSSALWDLPNSRPVHSLILSSHLFLCLHCFRPPFNVPCKMVLVRPDERETWPYHYSLRLFSMVRRSPCGPIVCL